MNAPQWLSLTDDDGRPIAIALAHLMAIGSPTNPAMGARVYFGMFQVDVAETEDVIRQRCRELRPIGAPV